MGSECGYKRNKVSHELELLNLGDGYLGDALYYSL